MPPSILPLISEHDYPAFQRRISDLVHISYDEWMDGHARAIAYRRLRNGSSEVTVSPDEFDLWLKTHRKTAHMELLWVCAEDKAARLMRPVLTLHH
jgi:hypothetical protein